MQNFDMPPLNQKIYNYIKSNFGTVQCFANKVGTSQQVVNRLFNIDRKSGKFPAPSTDLINKMVKSLGLDYEWFIIDDVEIDYSHAPKGIDNESRIERLKIARDFLKLTGRVKSNTDISIAMGKKQQNINMLFSGRLAISEQFLYSFNSAFDNIFMITWLINGEGELLSEKKPRDGENYDKIIKEYENEIASLKSKLQEAAMEIINLNNEIRALKN